MAKKAISTELFAAIEVACRLFGREIPRDCCDQGMFGFTARNFYATIAKILEIIAANEQLVMEFSELLARTKQDELKLGWIIYFPGRIAPEKAGER